MTENIYHRQINLPIDFIPFQVIGDDAIIVGDLSEKDLDLSRIKNTNPDLIAWLESLGLRVIKAKYFEGKPNIKYPIHKDDFRTYITSVIKLNFVFNSDGTEMIWYKLKPDHMPIPDKNSLGQYIYFYSESHIDEVYRNSADRHCILDANHVHTVSISENNNVNRKCYSLTLEYLGNQEERLNWSSTVEIFRSYLSS